MRSILFSTFLLVFLIVSCKQENSSNSVTTEESADTTETQIVKPERVIPSEPDHETYKSGGHDFTYLTDKLWHYDGGVGPKEMGDKPFEGEWIDFNSDGTFKAGKWADETHHGTWLYNETKKLLYIHPKETENHKITEWSIMFNDKMMVWQGTSTYGNNMIQVRLRRHETLPAVSK